MLYLVDVQIGDVVLPGIEVVGDELSEEPILGRNILNRLRVLLDGPNKNVTVTESRQLFRSPRIYLTVSNEE